MATTSLKKEFLIPKSASKNLQKAFSKTTKMKVNKKYEVDIK